MRDPTGSRDSSLIRVRLHAIRYAARDINLFEFRHATDLPLPPSTPGSHIGLHLTENLIRQYSLISASETPECYTVAVKREAEGRGGSRYLHDEIRVGTSLLIEPPRNNFELVESAEHSVFIAGGIGITPIKSMLERLLDLDRPFTLHYACRMRSDCAFASECAQLGNAYLHFDDQAGGVMDVGAIVSAAPASAHIYCCGPKPMLEAFEAAASDRPESNVHVEYFEAKEQAAVEGHFVVVLAHSGRRIEIQPGQTILRALLDAGLDLPFSCEAGICGTCETGVLEGAPDHRDAILSEAERLESKTMMICCSGSKTPVLVLDL